MSQHPAFTLRAPSSLKSDKGPAISPPTLSWLEGTWNVTHSTLPMWKKNQNVQITYTRVPNTIPVQIDDVVNYQPLGSSKRKTVHGLDKPFQVPGTRSEAHEDAASLAYNWRGKGWLMIASSKWEVLGHGDEEGTTNRWVVTYFAKTLFTPAGVDIYSRNGQLKPDTIESIKANLAGLGGDVAKLAQDIFAIKTDEVQTQ